MTLITNDEITAIQTFLNMPEDEYNQMKTVSPMVAHTVDLVRKTFLTS